MLRTTQVLDTFDFNGIGPGTFDLCTHLIQEVGQIYDFRFLSSILNVGDAFCQHCRHHNILCRTYAGKVQIDGVADEALTTSPGFHIAFGFVEYDLCPQGFQPFQMQVDGTCTDGTSAGQRHSGPSFSGKQRSHDENGSPHFIHQIILCLRRHNVLCDDGDDILLHIFDFCTQGG